MKPLALLLIPVAPLLLASRAQAQSEDLLPPALDEIVVTASPLPRTLFELAQPVSVLQGEELWYRRQGTLGETLSGEPGIRSTNFGPGASRPVIRGLGDDRVRILQNGTSVLDVSNVSPDHAVASDPSSWSRIEVVRGPASLLYGPNAVGGVVNLIDQRIAEQRFDGTWPSGWFDMNHGTVDDGKSVAGAVDWGVGPWVFHLDGFHREAGNLEIPGHARSRRLREQEPDGSSGFIPNSFSDSQGAGAGVSYVWEGGYAGVAYSGIDSFYGTVAEEDVSIDLRQRRWDLRGAFTAPAAWIREWNYKLGYTDYDHTELEGEEAGTRFSIDGFNARSELKHEKLGRLEGAVGVEWKEDDFSAMGEEAFLPEVKSRAYSLFVFEEVAGDRVTLQWGARYDRQSHDSAGENLSFDAYSLSAGLVYEPVDDYAIALSAAYTRRPPTYVELLADGLHVATGVYEIGDPGLGTENAFSLDLSVRKKTGWVTGSAGVFYTRFQDYISLQPTGEVFAEDDDEFAVYAYEATEAEFYGAEGEAVVHLLDRVEHGEEAKERSLDVILKADYVHARDRRTGEPLPRIPPLHASVGLNGVWNRWQARIEGRWAARQDRTADYELATDSYVLVNAGLSYQREIYGVTSLFYVKGTNLLDEEARESTSFLKDIAPLAGRGVVAGIRAEF